VFRRGTDEMPGGRSEPVAFSKFRAQAPPRVRDTLRRASDVGRTGRSIAPGAAAMTTRSLALNFRTEDAGCIDGAAICQYVAEASALLVLALCRFSGDAFSLGWAFLGLCAEGPLSRIPQGATEREIAA
jgi:hypothetical protein